MARAPRAASVVTTLPVAELAPARAGHRRSSGDLVADHIRRLIFEGRLRQGDHLRQDEIALELGVSRIPVREAVIALDREGWLMIEPHRGAFVHGLDEDAVRDHYEVFGLIYGLTARRATERGSAERVAESGRRAASRSSRPTTQTLSFAPTTTFCASSSRWPIPSGWRRSPGCCATSFPAISLRRSPARRPIRSAVLPRSAKAVRAGDGELAERECLTLMRRQGDAVVALLAARQLFRPSAMMRRGACKASARAGEITDEAVATLRQRIGIPEPHPLPPHYLEPGSTRSATCRGLRRRQPAVVRPGLRRRVRAGAGRSRRRRWSAATR